MSCCSSTASNALCCESSSCPFVSFVVNISNHQGHKGSQGSQLKVALTILSGSRTGSPRLILSTFSMPDTTLPQTVYWRLRKGASAKQMKNCELAESGL